MTQVHQVYYTGGSIARSLISFNITNHKRFSRYMKLYRFIDEVTLMFHRKHLTLLKNFLASFSFSNFGIV